MIKMNAINPIQARPFYRLKGLYDPYDFRIIRDGSVKLCKVIVLPQAYQNTKEIFKNLAYDVTTTLLLKQWENSDLREARQIMYRAKGNESFPNM